MKVAALDLGSNSFLCLIAEVDSFGKISVLSDSMEVVRLGQGVTESKQLDLEALERASRCLSRFKEIIFAYKPDQIYAVATAAARSARNAHQLIEIGSQLGIPVSVISGEKEAELTFLGAISNRIRESRVAIVDIGGGSTELIVGTPPQLEFRKSFDIGVVQLKEQWINNFPMDPSIKSQILFEIQNSMQDVAKMNWSGNYELIAVAGTPTTLAAIILGGYDPNAIEGFCLTKEQLLEWQERLLIMTPQEIEKEFNVPKGRADVLGIGIMILIAVLDLFRVNQLTVSVRGLRFGLALALAQGGFNL